MATPWFALGEKVGNWISDRFFGNQSAATNDTSVDIPAYLDTIRELQSQNQEAQIEQNRIEREFQAQSALDADRRWQENLQFSVDKQRELRQTQYQDYVESLKQAGLNPMLAVYSGTPSTPSVSASSHSASGGNSNVGLDTDSVSDFYKTFVSSAFDVLESVIYTTGNVIASTAKNVSGGMSHIGFT